MSESCYRGHLIIPCQCNCRLAIKCLWFILCVPEGKVLFRIKSSIHKQHRISFRFWNTDHELTSLQVIYIYICTVSVTMSAPGSVMLFKLVTIVFCISIIIAIVDIGSKIVNSSLLMNGHNSWLLIYWYRYTLFEWGFVWMVQRFSVSHLSVVFRVSSGAPLSVPWYRRLDAEIKPLPMNYPPHIQSIQSRMVWIALQRPCSGIFNVHTVGDACDCALDL